MKICISVVTRTGGNRSHVAAGRPSTSTSKLEQMALRGGLLSKGRLTSS